MKLSQKIILLFAGVSIGILVLTGGFLHSKLREEKFAAIHDGFQSQLAHIDFALTRFFRDVESDLISIASDDRVRIRDGESFTNFLNANPETFTYAIGEAEQSIIDLFNRYRTTHDFVNSVYMGRENGDFVRSHKRARPTAYDPRTRPWYTLAKDHPGKVMRTAPYPSITTSAVNIGLVTALVDQAGQVFGVVGIDITLDNLADYLEMIQVSRGGWASMTDAEGTILAARDPAVRFKNIREVDPAVASAVLESPSGVTLFSEGAEKRYLFFRTSPELGWKIAFVFPAEEIDREIRALVLKVLLALLAALALLSGLTLTGLRRFVIKPLKQLDRDAEHIARTCDLNHQITIRSRDEIGSLARTFNQMMDTIRTAEDALKASEDQLRRHRDNLEERVENRTAELKRSERQMAQIIDFLPDPTLVVDCDGKVLAWNKAMVRLTGIRAEDMIGRNEYEYALPFYGERRPILIDLIRNWNDEYEKKYLSIRKKRDMLISESHHPEMGERGLYLSGTAGLLYGVTGEVAGAIESLRDITAIKLTEMELQKLSRAVEQSPTSVVITDPQGNIEYVNPKFTDITGYDVNEVIGQNPRILNAGELPPEHYRSLWETITAGNEWHGELCNRKKSGELFWEYAHISPLRNAEGDITHFVGVKEDITDRKRMEAELIQAKTEADEANRAKGDFLANMSHEIRTPMNAVIGMAHLALKTDLTAKQRDYLTKIQASANALLGIINDILDFSKIEAGRLDMEAVDFDLERVFDNLANLLAVKAGENEHIEVLFDIAPDVPRALVGDPLRLGQVLINLAGNAVKFTRSGQIVVSANFVSRESDRVTLKFTVQDTGIGLSREQAESLFEPFTQADTSTTRKYGGTGLGLAICKRLVDMMDGEIGVESTLGVGSTFSFTAVLGMGRKPADRRRLPPADLRGLKVMVVDDNPTSREILRSMLESFTFEVTLAASGPEGLAELSRKAGERPVDLIVMDWKMPEMDGIETARQIKARIDLPAIPPVILITAYGREEIMKQAEAAGLDGFLIKPVSPSVLFDTIMQALGKDAAKAPLPTTIDDLPVPPANHLAGYRVLIVEDNDINRQVAQEILTGAGLKVTLASDGRQAIDSMEKQRVDAVLMDVQMPVMDGYTATRLIRRRPEFKDLPIIAMTAHAMTGDREKSLAAGMNDHVNKPIDPAQLLATLSLWIRPGDSIGDEAAARPAEKLSRPPARSVAPVADGLPGAMPGFDLEEGLRRLQGNRTLYRRLIGRLADDCLNAGTEIRSAIARGDITAAQRRVHTIKGMAGNLSARALQAAASDLENLLSQKNSAGADFSSRLNHALEPFESALDQALHSARTLMPEQAATAEGKPHDDLSIIPRAIATEAAVRLREAAALGDVAELASIAGDIAYRCPEFATVREKITALADNFDFEGIQAIIEQMETSQH